MKHIKKCRKCDVVLVAGSKVTNPKGNCYPSNMELGKVICNSCVIQYYSQHEKIRRENKTVGCTIHIQDMLKGARERARKNNLEWDLTVAHLREIMTDTCPILGVKFKLNKKNLKWNKEGNDWRTSPSLDRIVPDKGYTKDNIIIVSLMANSIKNQASPDQIQKVATFYKKLYNERGITYGN